MISLSLLIALFGRRKRDLTDGIVKGTVLWAFVLYAATEILSLFHALTRGSLFVFYLLFIGTEVFLLIRERRRDEGNAPDLFGLIADGIRGNREAAVFVSLLSVLVVVFAVRRVPDNLDSMTYHLSRVVHWTENRSIEHYATNIVRQVTCPVLSEIMVLHAYILLGKNDILSALPQAVAYILNGILVFGIGRKLGLSRKEGNLAALLFYTMPIAFAEAQTTQTDMIAAFFALAFGWLTLEFFDSEGPCSWKFLGLTAGLGYLTKVNICIPMFGFCAGILVFLLKDRSKVSRILVSGGTIGGIALLTALPEIARNMVTFGHTSDPIITSGLLVGNRNPAYLFVSFLKTFCFNMPAPWLYGSSDAIYNVVSAAARLFRVNIDDPSIAHVGRAYLVSAERAYSSETGTAPLVFWLFVIGIFLYPAVRKKLDLIRRIYAVSATLTFLAFLAMLRWTPYIARYMIGSLGLLCPAVVLIFREKLGGEKKNLVFRSILLFISAAELFGMIVFHGGQVFSSRRPEDYFLSDTLREDYAKAADLVNAMGEESIGLWMGEDDPEYSLLMLLKNRKDVRHVLTDNGSKRYEDPGFQPDVIIAVGRDAGEVLECNGGNYVLCGETKDSRAEVYVRK